MGLVEALSFLGQPGPTFGGSGAAPSAGQILRGVDPVLYAAMILAAFVPPGLLLVAPLQVAGIVVTVLFVSGLCYVWLAFAEPATGGRPPDAG